MIEMEIKHRCWCLTLLTFETDLTCLKYKFLQSKCGNESNGSLLDVEHLILEIK